jgi:hypothetical protein
MVVLESLCELSYFHCAFVLGQKLVNNLLIRQVGKLPDVYLVLLVRLFGLFRLLLLLCLPVFRSLVHGVADPRRKVIKHFLCFGFLFVLFYNHFDFFISRNRFLRQINLQIKVIMYKIDL